MLTSLELENFKGIAARQRIDFAPLTLLFGANSAGKSTVLQALLYLHELLERGNADVDETELGGSVVELGGFARIVHQHDTKATVTIRAEFATPGALERLGRDLRDFPLPDFDDDIDSAWVELCVRHRTSAAFRGPIIDSVTFGVNRHCDPLVWLSIGSSLRDGEPLFARLNVKHPVLANLPEETLDDWTAAAVPRETQGSLFRDDERLRQLAAPEPRSADEDSSLPVFALASSGRSALPPLRDPLRVLVPTGDDPSRRQADALEQVRNLLEMVILGTANQLAALLRETIYVGPLRAVPPRGTLYESSGRATSWADGLAAWDRLLGDRRSLVLLANEWLRRLDTGCQVRVQSLIVPGADSEQVAEQHPDKTGRRLLLEGRDGSLVLPSEVGAGISQVVPIVIAAMDRRPGMLLIEQPEIHVHPAIQVRLGDLFATEVLRTVPRRMALVETHSEHLLLRLMRLIRMTTQNKLDDGMARVEPQDVSVLFVERDGAKTIIRQMPLNERGELVKAWPGGFFEEGLQEVL